MNQVGIDGLLRFLDVQVLANPKGVLSGQTELSNQSGNFTSSGTLNLPEDCARAASVAGGPFKFTLTSPYMLARTLLDEHYRDFRALTLAIADALAAQVRDLDCAVSPALPRCCSSRNRHRLLSCVA